MPVQKSAVSGSREEQIKALAYRLWLEEGQPHGRADVHWFKAVELVEKDPGSTGKPKVRKAAAATRATPGKPTTKKG